MNSIEKRILSEDVWGLCAIMHEAFIEDLADAMELMKKGATYGQLSPIYSHLREILMELLKTFSENHPLSLDLKEIYLFQSKLLAEGFRKSEVEKIEKSISIMYPLYDAFKTLSKTYSPLSCENNSASTYGKTALIDKSVSQGFDLKS